ncbi:MOSC domain-containing protein, partial [Streptomyces anulatus]|uniref:MOSC domain-containing protein n=1 Tax=Streptomyces anulatus TaxID=1892 RepID=UPI0036A5B59A
AAPPPPPPPPPARAPPPRPPPPPPLDAGRQGGQGRHTTSAAVPGADRGRAAALIASGDRPEEGPLPMDRFRPNVVIGGTEAWAEDGWRRIAIGGVAFTVAKPCGRCVITTTDQHTAERGREPLLTPARHRRFGKQLVFGQNLIPEGMGVIRVGDPVRILDR